MEHVKKHRIILSIVIILVLVCSIKVFVKEEKNEDKKIKGDTTFVYLLLENILVEYPFESFAETEEEKIVEILDCLMQENSEFTPMLYKNSVIEQVEIKERKAIIHFSMIDYDLSKERKLLESLIYSCTQFKNIDSVSLFLKGEELTMMPKGGLPLQDTSRTFGINAIDTNQQFLHEGNSTTLYYMKKMGENLFYVPRSVRVKNKDDYHEILESLLNAPNASIDLIQPLAKHKIVSEKATFYEDGILHIYLNSNILEHGKINDECSEVLRKTFQMYKTIEMIQIHVKDEVYDVNI